MHFTSFLPVVYTSLREWFPSTDQVSWEKALVQHIYFLYLSIHWISHNYTKIVRIVRLKCDELLLMIVFHFVAYKVLTFVPSLYCSYTLYGLTFYVRHRQHYTCKIKHFGKWVHYDGLTEKQCPGSGLSVQHILAQLGTPSHCFYAQLWGTQCRSGLKKGWAKIIRATFQLDHDQLTSILLSHLFWIFQSTFKLQLMILAAITMLWAFLNCFLLFF